MVWLPGQVIVGGSLSVTVTVNEQVAAGVQVLVAVTTTSVTPLLKRRAAARAVAVVGGGAW
ncbi:MAG: hypothetical protein IPJ82_23645 [Lewinellaceae bacterium]|nr:hypothetical protein [Lewinellaceae bacterium]